MKVIASAPGKITLYGEHAVVYGYPAIVASINKRVSVTCEPRNDDRIRVSAINLQIPGITLTYDDRGELILETDYGRVLSAMSYIKEGIKIASEYIDEKKGVNLVVKSSMPVGAGLGTSAAVAVATIAAYTKTIGHELKREEIAKLAWQTEKAVQGLASPMDTHISTFGGIIYIKYNENNVKIERLQTNIKEPIVIGYVTREYKTKDLVNKVKQLKNRYPFIIEPIIETIGKLVQEARNAVLNGDTKRAGELMNLNHGLLEALGVSSQKLNELVYAARSMGALGSKMSGAGGGGSMIALTKRERIAEISSAIKILGGKVIDTEIGGNGLIMKISR